MDRGAIETFAVWARNKLIQDTHRAGSRHSSWDSHAFAPSTADLQLFDVGLNEVVEVRGAAIEQTNSRRNYQPTNPSD